MPGSVGNILECITCYESLRFYNNLDKYFHFLRHYNEKRLLAGQGMEDQTMGERRRNVEIVAELKTLVNYHKSLSQADPSFQVCS